MNLRFCNAWIPLAIGLTVLTASAAADWTDQAFPIKKHDFGTVAVASKTEFRFPVVNPLSQPMHIQTIRASCGCTTPVVETPYIEPGQSGSILAKFNTPTFRGKKGATLTVVIDKPFYTEVRLRVDGYIRSDMVFHPGEIDFGMINRGDAISKSTKVMYAGRSDWEVNEVRSDKPWIQASKVQTKRSGGSVEYSIDVAIREDAPEGFFQEQVVLMTNDRQMPQVPLVVTGRVDAALTIAPQSLALGQLKPGQSVEERMVIRGKEPFTIDSITCEGWDVTFEPISQAKTIHIFTAKFTPTTATGQQKRVVVIKTGGDDSVTAKAMLTADVR